MACRLSIIIPCYNMGKYLHNCLQSIMAEQLSDCEVICVNDGSTDNTTELFREFKFSPDRIDRYPSLRLIQQENQGVSVARNTGIENASGAYITFVDPDDTLYPGGLCNMLDFAERMHNPDWVVGGYRKITETGAYEDFIPKEISFEGPDTPRDVFEKVSISFTSSPWAKLYRRDFLNKYQLRFRMGMVNSQDTEFNSRLLRSLRSFAAYPRLTYTYIQNEVGATARFRGESVIEAKVNLIKTRTETIDFLFPENGLREIYQAENIKSASFVWLSTIYLLYKSNISHKLKWLRRISSEADKINPHWIENFRTGNPRIIRFAIKLGLPFAHLFLSAIAAVPLLRKRLRG